MQVAGNCTRASCGRHVLPTVLIVKIIINPLYVSLLGICLLQDECFHRAVNLLRRFGFITINLTYINVLNLDLTIETQPSSHWTTTALVFFSNGRFCSVQNTSRYLYIVCSKYQVSNIRSEQWHLVLRRFMFRLVWSWPRNSVPINIKIT